MTVPMAAPFLACTVHKSVPCACAIRQSMAKASRLNAEYESERVRTSSRGALPSARIWPVECGRDSSRRPSAGRRGLPQTWPQRPLAPPTRKRDCRRSAVRQRRSCYGRATAGTLRTSGARRPGPWVQAPSGPKTPCPERRERRPGHRGFRRPGRRPHGDGLSVFQVGVHARLGIDEPGIDHARGALGIARVVQIESRGAERKDRVAHGIESRPVGSEAVGVGLTVAAEVRAAGVGGVGPPVRGLAVVVVEIEIHAFRPFGRDGPGAFLIRRSASARRCRTAS